MISEEDQVLAEQANDFVVTFSRVRDLLQQITQDSALQGGATGSGDLNAKMLGSRVTGSGGPVTGAGTVLTTQHQAQNSHSSIQNTSQDNLQTMAHLKQKESNWVKKEMTTATHSHELRVSKKPSQMNAIQANSKGNNTPQLIVSEDTSINQDRNLLSGLNDQSPLVKDDNQHYTQQRPPRGQP